MSGPIHTIPLPPIYLTARQLATIVANADNLQQEEFFAHFAYECSKMKGGWPFQCRHIVERTGMLDKMSPAERNAIAAPLKTLLEHLEEQA